MTIAERDWDAAVEALRSATDVALVCHMRPDGDALGSMLALHLALHHLGIASTASWSADPFRLPRHYEYLPGQALLTSPADFPQAPALLVTFDTGSLDRLGTLAPVADAAGQVLVIDHHASNTRYGDLDLIDFEAAGSVVIVRELIRRLGAEIDRDIATCLYTGLTTDTGSFRFASATADVHHFAAELIATGIAAEQINRSIWDSQRLAYLKLLGRVLERTVLEPEHSLVWSWISNADLAEYGVTMEEVEGAIDLLRTTAEADVAVICKQDVDGRYAVSMRSKTRLDVSAIAVECGGGGHRSAAGFTSDESVEDILARVRKQLPTAHA